MSPKYLSKLYNKRILVLGGTAGIGYGIAEASVEFGAHVVVASSQQGNVDKAIKTLETTHPEAKGRITGTVTDTSASDIEATLTALFEFATDNNTVKLDHVVNTAGSTAVGTVDLSNASPDKLHALFSARIVPIVFIAKLAPKYLNPSHESSITFTSGTMAYKPLPGMSIAAGITLSIEGLTRGFAKDLAPLRVNLVVPGAIRTGLLERIVSTGLLSGPNAPPPESGTVDLEQALNGLAQHSLLKHTGTVEDIVETYLSTIRDYFQTGSVIHSEGGYLRV